MFKKMMHLAFWTRDMDKMLKFYVDVLGLEKIFDMDNVDGTPGTVYLRTPDNRYVELFHGGTEPAKDASGRAVGYSHLCFEVDDIDEAMAYLESKGVEIRVRSRVGRAKNVQCWVDDPDGNPIEIMQLLPGCPILEPPADGRYVPDDLK